MARASKRAVKGPVKNAGGNAGHEGSAVEGHGVMEGTEEDRQEESIFDVTGDETVRIERQSERTGRYEFHGYIPHATESVLAETFGGGKYRVKLIRPNPITNRREIVTQRELTIPGAYKPPAELPGLPKVAASGGEGESVGPKMVPDRPMSLNETLNTALVSQVLEVMRTTKEAARPAIDWGAVLVPTLAVVGQVIEHMMTRPKGESESTRVLLDQLAELRRELAAVRTQPGPAQNAIGDAVKAIRELMEVRDLVTGEGRDKGADPESAMWSLGEKVLGMLGQAGAAGAAPVARAPSGDVAPASPETGTTLPMWQRLLLHYRPQLLATAQKGIDPGFAADVAAQFMPGNLEGVAMEFVRRPDAAAVAAQIIPELQEFPKWNEAFWRMLRTILLEDEPEATVVENESETEGGA